MNKLIEDFSGEYDLEKCEDECEGYSWGGGECNGSGDGNGDLFEDAGWRWSLGGSGLCFFLDEEDKILKGYLQPNSIRFILGN